MEIKDLTLPYKQSSPVFHLYCISDLHAGTIHCCEDGIKRKVAEIAQKSNTFWIGLGDYGEFIMPNDKRFDPSQRAIAPWVETDNISECQRRWIVNLFKPIKNKCIGLLYGNHEESIRHLHYTNIHENICNDLGVDNLGYSCFIRFYFKRENSNEAHLITGAFTHGSGCAVTKGAKLNRLRRFMDDFDARLYGYAHMHDIIIDSKPFMTVEGKKDKGDIKAEESVGAVTGSWFRTYTKGVVASYGETRAYPPTSIGCVKFTINANTGEVEAHKSERSDE